MVCGETEVTASSLRSFTESLSDPVGGSGPTLSQQHLKVCSTTTFETILNEDSVTRFWRILVLSKSVTLQEPRLRQTSTKTDSQINCQVKQSSINTITGVYFVVILLNR